MKQLSMLDGTARLRVAEQRARDGLRAPHIDVQALPPDAKFAPRARVKARRGTLIAWVGAIVVIGGIGLSFLR